ncbi:hypothetical protein D9M71_233420 [compost metagenome]
MPPQQPTSTDLRQSAYQPFSIAADTRENRYEHSPKAPLGTPLYWHKVSEHEPEISPQDPAVRLRRRGSGICTVHALQRLSATQHHPTEHRLVGQAGRRAGRQQCAELDERTHPGPGKPRPGRRPPGRQRRPPGAGRPAFVHQQLPVHLCRPVQRCVHPAPGREDA